MVFSRAVLTKSSIQTLKQNKTNKQTKLLSKLNFKTNKTSKALGFGPPLTTSPVVPVAAHPGRVPWPTNGLPRPGVLAELKERYMI